jgi:SAM-dependent methyltransferase
VLDVGGGQSFLVDRLLDAGFEHVAVLDISQTAIEATKARLGERASQVEWIVADITHAIHLASSISGTIERCFTSSPIQTTEALRGIAEAILPIGGHFVVGTFAKGGPEKCSGLPICQYDAATMQAELGPSFEPCRMQRVPAHTPSFTGKPEPAI